MKVISIHQPNFMPWIPFFEKIYQSDIFVALTHCQFEKNNYQNRFKMNGEWYTMAVQRGNIPIIEKTYENAERDWNRIKDKLSKHKRVLSTFDNDINMSLASTNLNIIRHICSQHLRVKTPIVQDYPTALTGTARLIDICKHYGATHYLSGPSGRNYLETEKFKEHGIELRFFESENTLDIISFLSSEE